MPMYVVQTPRILSTDLKRLHNHNKILKSDWLSTVLSSVLIGKCNRTVHVKLQPSLTQPRTGVKGSLSKDVFEQRTSTGSEAFSLLICRDDKKFVLLSFFSLIKTIYSRVSTKPLPNDSKSPLPVDVRRWKTLLLKLPIDDGDGDGSHFYNEFAFFFFKLCRLYYNAPKMSNVGEFLWSWFRADCTQV